MEHIWGVRAPFPSSQRADAWMVQTDSFRGTEKGLLSAADDLGYVLKVSPNFSIILV